MDRLSIINIPHHQKKSRVNSSFYNYTILENVTVLIFPQFFAKKLFSYIKKPKKYLYEIRIIKKQKTINLNPLLLYFIFTSCFTLSFYIPFILYAIQNVFLSTILSNILVFYRIQEFCRLRYKTLETAKKLRNEVNEYFISLIFDIHCSFSLGDQVY